MNNIEHIKEYIKLIKDFPKKGINFRDITPIFQKPDIVNEIIDLFCDVLKNLDFDYIAGIESRGFLFGLPLSLKMNKPFVLIRKPNKLPNETYKQEISLEYGNSTIELQKEDIKPNSRVVIIDDLLATGGTVSGAEKLIEQAKSTAIMSLFLIEISSLNGAKNLKSKVFSILKY